jgi:hypothetical protein
MKPVKLKEVLGDCVCGLPIEKMEYGCGDFMAITEWYDCEHAEYLYLQVIRRDDLAIVEVYCDGGVLYHRHYKK